MSIASPPDDGDDGTHAKAKVFFDRGTAVARTGNFDFAIEMYIQGLRVDPENVSAHQDLRDISLKRKASGGKDVGMFERMKLPKAGDAKQAMLNAEKLLAYLPDDIRRIRALLDAARNAGLPDTSRWIEAILRGAAGS